MDPLKKMLLDLEEEKKKEIEEKVVVVGYTISDCLKKAAEYFKKDITLLDYEILEKGKKGLFKKKPYKLLVSVGEEPNPYADLEEFAMKLGVGEKLLSPELDQYIQPKNLDGTFKVRIYKEGVFLTVCPPKGEGKPVEVEECVHRLEQRGVNIYDIKKVEKVVQEAKCEPVKIAEYEPIPEHDSTCRVEITPDEMKAFIKITPPKKGGRDLKLEDIISILRAKGIIVGLKEDNIRKALEEERYMEDILAAEGKPPRHGRDAYIDYKVRVRRELRLEEDEHGRVDYKNLHLIENVVPGQILAEKIPPEKGQEGKTLFGKIIPAKDGKDIELKPGKNVVLEEGRILKAEISGQVVMIGNRISVEDVYRVLGDVGTKTGNIEFLGSVNIAGSVLDNHSVKAGGNIEIFNSVQKATVEAEGNIIIKGGILGKDEGQVISSNGSVIARFIQGAQIFAAVDVMVEEAIMHSRVEAGERVICQGRRAQIVGGEIIAKQEVRARIIGSAAHPRTEIVVGYDPILLNRFKELETTIAQKKEELDRLKRTRQTLETRKKEDPDSFLAEQRKKLEEVSVTIQELEEEIQELEQERESSQKEMENLAKEGVVIVEKQIFPGVTIKIRDAVYNVMDERSSVQYVYQDGKIIEQKYEKKVRRR